MVTTAHVPGVQRVRLSSVEVIHVRDTLLLARRQRRGGGDEVVHVHDLHADGLRVTPV